MNSYNSEVGIYGFFVHFLQICHSNDLYYRFLWYFTSSLFLFRKPLKGYHTYTNSEDPDEMPQKLAFHQGLHCLIFKVSKGEKISNQYNHVPHLTQVTNGKVTNSQI